MVEVEGAVAGAVAGVVIGAVAGAGAGVVAGAVAVVVTGIVIAVAAAGVTGVEVEAVARATRSRRAIAVVAMPAGFRTEVLSCCTRAASYNLTHILPCAFSPPKTLCDPPRLQGCGFMCRDGGGDCFFTIQFQHQRFRQDSHPKSGISSFSHQRLITDLKARVRMWAGNVDRCPISTEQCNSVLCKTSDFSFTCRACSSLSFVYVLIFCGLEGCEAA